jgi:hypothetical protein
MKKKKIYLAPEMIIVDVEHNCLLAGSGVGANSYVEAEYGGVDNSGTKDPAAKEFGFEVAPSTNNEEEEDWMDEEEDL